MAAQGLDESRQRGQGGAQLVAGVGQEIGPGALDLAQFGFVAEGQQRQSLAIRRGLQRPGVRPQGLGLDAGDLIDAVRRDAAEQRLVDRLQHLRIADRGDQQTGLAVQPQELSRRPVGEQVAPRRQILGIAGGNHQDRIGQGVGEARVRGTGRLRVRRLQRLRARIAAPSDGQSDQRHDPDDGRGGKPRDNLQPARDDQQTERRQGRRRDPRDRPRNKPRRAFNRSRRRGQGQRRFSVASILTSSNLCQAGDNRADVSR